MQGQRARVVKRVRYVPVNEMQAGTLELHSGVALLSELQEGYYQVDLQGRIQFANAVAAEMMCRRPGELVGKSYRDMIDADAAQDVRATGRTVLAAGEPRSIQVPAAVSSSGEQRVFEVSMAPLVEASGRRAGIHGLIRDVSAEVASKLGMHTVAQVYQRLVDNNPAAICLVDRDGFIRRANRSCERVLGYTVQELTGMHYVQLFPTDYDPSIHDNFAELLKGRMHRDNRLLRLRHKLGHIVDFGVKAVPADIDGKIEGVFYIGRDVSDYKRAEEIIIKSEKLAVIGQLAAGVAHEIRNPLTSLKGFVQLLEATVDSKPEYFQIMLSELDRIESIIQEFLLFAKPQISNFTFADPHEMLQHVIAIIQAEAMLHNVEVVDKLDPSVPMLWCEENHLKQVFMNILKNGVEAMPDGGTLTVEMTVDGDAVIICAVDNGCGIPPERIPKLGEPFYTTKEKGTGLGLMVSHRILEAHRGTMTIRSVLGRGTRVEVRIPLGGPEELQNRQDGPVAGLS